MLGLVFGGVAARRRGDRPRSLTLVGWLVDARKEYVKTVEADRTGHLESLPAPRTPKAACCAVLGRAPDRRVRGPGRLAPAAGAAVAAAAVRRSRRARAAPGEPGRVEPGAGGPDPRQPSSTVHAKDVAFVETTIGPRLTARSSSRSSTRTRPSRTTSTDRRARGSERLQGRGLPGRRDQGVRGAGTGRRNVSRSSARSIRRMTGSATLE